MIVLTISFWLWTKRNYALFIIKREIVSTILFLSIRKETKIYSSECIDNRRSNTYLTALVNRPFQYAVQSLFVFANSNCYWLRWILDLFRLTAGDACKTNDWSMQWGRCLTIYCGCALKQMCIAAKIVYARRCSKNTQYLWSTFFMKVFVVRF